MTDRNSHGTGAGLIWSLLAFLGHVALAIIAALTSLVVTAGLDDVVPPNDNV